jgi:hypothetical protein
MSIPTENTASQFGATGPTNQFDPSMTILTEARVRILPIEPLTNPEPIPDAKGSLTSDQLREIAKRRQPAASWLEGDEEQLF